MPVNPHARSWSAAALAGVALLAAFPSCRSASGGNGGPPAGAARVTRRAVEDVFLLTGELRAMRSVSIQAPRSEGPLQIRWMADDGADVAAGERVLELDASRVIQTI